MRVTDGRVVVRLAPSDPPDGRSGDPAADRPADRPAIAVLAAGDVLVPPTGRALVVDPVGAGRLEPLADPDPAGPDLGPALERWWAGLAEAADLVVDDPAPGDAPPHDPGGPGPVGGWADQARRHTDELIAVVVDRQAQRAAQLRRPRPVTTSVVDAAAIDELAAAVPRLRARSVAAVADPVGALLARIGAPVSTTASTTASTTVSTTSAPGTPTAGAEEPGGDVLAGLLDRARAAGHLMRTVDLGPDCRRTLLGPVAAVLDGRPVALVPRLRGTLLVDPAMGVHRRLTRGDVPQLGSTGVGVVSELPERAGWRSLGRLAGRGVRSDLALLVLIAVVAGSASMLLPLAGQAIFGSIVPGNQPDRLAALVAALTAVIAATAVLTLLQGRIAARVRTRLDAAVGDAVWARLLRLPAAFFNRHGTGELLMRASVVDTLRLVVADSLVSATVAGVSVLVSLLLIVLQSWQAGLLTLAVVAVQTAAFWWVVGRWQPLVQRQVTEQQQLADLTLQTMRGIARIRASGAEERVMRQLAARFAPLASTSFRSASWSSVVSTGLAAWGTLGTLAITAGVVLSGSGSGTAAQYVLLTTALGQVLAGSSSLVTTAAQLVGVGPQVRQLTPILEAVPETVQPTGTASTATATRLRGGVELSSVTFRYTPDGPDVVRGVSLAVRPGEFVAVVGPSGSGKSTLVRLLLGFERPQQGVVAYDGVSLDRLDVREVRRRIGTVLQSSPLFPGSLADNIRGSRPLTQQQLWRAAEAAAVADDIRRMPMGLQTAVVEGASTLSGGQRQRIVLARALAARPAVLLLDEATSALDNVAQAQVAASLDRLRVTRIVIAHRLSTIRHADRIVVLDAGRIVQQGGYEELLAQPGLFADLVGRQLLDR